MTEEQLERSLAPCFSFQTAWKRACFYSQHTGVNCAVLRDIDDEYVVCPFPDGGENAVRAACKALNAKFMRRTLVLK